MLMLYVLVRYGLSLVAYSEAFTVLIDVHNRTIGTTSARHIAYTGFLSVTTKPNRRGRERLSEFGQRFGKFPWLEPWRKETPIPEQSVRPLLFTVNPPHLTFLQSIHQPTIVEIPEVPLIPRICEWPVFASFITLGVYDSSIKNISTNNCAEIGATPASLEDRSTNPGTAFATRTCRAHHPL